MNRLMQVAFKILIAIVLIFQPIYSQFSTSSEAWRVVFVSPNYKNIYPRYTTLQQTWNAIKDSASVSTGKYFIINVVTNLNNITDYSSSYKDSILNRAPYMTLASFGFSVDDTIAGINEAHFTLPAQILNLKSATAGDGLTFTSDMYNIVTQNYLGNALYIDGDSLKLRVQVPLYFTPNLLGIKVSTNSGIRFSDSVYIVPYKEVYTDNDTLLIRKSFYFLPYDSLTLDWNTQHFNLIYGESPAINVKLDSGLNASADGIRAWLDNVRVTYTSAGRITLPSTLAGTGLIWTGDSLNVGLSYQFQPYNDSLWIDFNTRQFELLYGESPSVNIALDSGMTYASSGATTGIKPKIDYSTLIFNSLLQLVVNPTLAGGGLLMTAGVIGIVPNDFAKIENDTLKINTGSVFTWQGDSLNSTFTYCPPYDTLGIGMPAKGYAKRIAISYVTTTGNDTTIIYYLNSSWNAGQRIALWWNNGSQRFELYKDKVTWQNLNVPNITLPYKKDWVFAMESYQEAQ